MTRPRDMTTLAELLADRDTLVLSPHMDDALLSAAAIVLSRPTEVWTVFTGSPDPAMTTTWDLSCGFPDSDATIRARRAEDTAAFAGTPAATRHLDHLEGAYATRDEHRAALPAIQAEIESWMFDHPTGVVIAPACAGLHMPPAPWQPLVERLGAARARRGPARASEAPEPSHAAAESAPTTVIEIPSDAGTPAPMPKRVLAQAAGLSKGLAQRALHAEHLHRRRRTMGEDGLAANPDHLALRDVTLAAAAGHPGVQVVLFEDLPYLWHARGDAEVARLERTIDLVARRVELPVDVAQKHAHLSEYVSQLPVLDKQGRLLHASSLPDHEIYWVLERPAST